ncbi:unnamed protein product [Phytophthora fragariaefolia]|uniref:Unnamed protein product n=1 Tax=Phytophthora fragariaefolia TaxID=1490495 RepID=A0A9W6Y8F8_9STRA|nr:unnamed protein product [Phytophthora fragariaefolia]
MFGCKEIHAVFQAGMWLLHYFSNKIVAPNMQSYSHLLLLSYLIDVMSALPELKTLDAFTDEQLQSHREKLKNGLVSQEELLTSSRASTPSYRPGSAASRPGSARERTPSGRLATPDSAPVFHVPSARIGNLKKLTSEDELAKAEEEVRNRLQKMKQLLHRVGTSTDEAAALDEKEMVGQPRSIQRRTSAPVDTISASIAAKTSDLATKAGTRSNGGHKLEPPVPSTSTSVDVASEAKRFPKVVHRARTVQSLIRRSCVDAGTDPLESLMSNIKSGMIQTPVQGCEMETQTTLPPAPLLSVSKSDSLREPESKSPEKHYDQNNEAYTTPEGTMDKDESRLMPQQDGDAIEAEMKQFLLQHAVASVAPEDNQSGAEEQPEEDVDPTKFWSDSPRLDPIKTAEKRKPPTSLSRTGYKTFRMPSRPSSSESLHL